MRELTATVVGGGIAGLASAVALAQAGWRTRVLESRSGSAEVGAGVGLPRNGVAALHALGLDDALIERIGCRTVTIGFRDLRGRPLLQVPDDREDVRWAITVWGFHRQKLHTALWEAARGAGVELSAGTRVTDVDPGTVGGAPARVTWQDTGTERSTESDLVVGADGLWSAVRTELHPDAHPRYSGSTSWRAIVPEEVFRGAGLDDRLVEYWGPGAEFGTMGVGDGQAYWYGYIQHPEKAVFDDELAAVRARFGDWAPEIVNLIGATTSDQLMRHDVHHLPGGLANYVRGRVVMVGDAAHAALPTMGQGASTALEDGISIGRLVGTPAAGGQDLGRALVAYDADRRPRCRSVARQAFLMARFGAGLGGGWRQGLRNSVLRLVPGRFAAKAGSSIVRWIPPEPPALSGQVTPG